MPSQQDQDGFAAFRRTAADRQDVASHGKARDADRAEHTRVDVEI